VDRAPGDGEVAAPSVAPEAELGIPVVGRVLHGKERERAIARHLKSLENPIDYSWDFSAAPIALFAARRPGKLQPKERKWHRNSRS
jgi:hypothetical protein